MIVLKTNDERLKGFCDLWNAILQEDRSHENITLFNGDSINRVEVLINVPVLDLDNHSLNPHIYKGDQTTVITIPFYFPKDFKSMYDMSMLLDSLTWIITDTLSVYSSMNTMHRYWLEQNLQHKNEYFLKSVISGLNLDQTLKSLNDRVLLNEIRLSAPLKSISLPSPDEIEMKEEISHIAHKVRLTGYLYIASTEDVMTLTSTSLFSLSWPKLLDEVEFVSVHLNTLYTITNSLSEEEKFFSFIKHLTASAKALPYFPKGSLKELNAKQLNSIVKTAKIPGNFDKNKPIETTFTQMIIIHFYIVMKQNLSPDEFTNIVREEQISLETHYVICQSASEILPHKVVQQLKETLERCSRFEKFDLNEMLPKDVLLQDPDVVAEMNDSKRKELRKKFEGLSKKYQSVVAEDNIKVFGNAIRFLVSIFYQEDYLNTVMSHYSNIRFLDILDEITKMIEHLEEIQENQEETSEVLEFLLMDISDHQSEKEFENESNDPNFNYYWSNSDLLSEKYEEKHERITDRIRNFLSNFESQLQSARDIEDYKEFLNDLETEDAYIDELRDYMNEIDEFAKHSSKTLINEEKAYKLIYGVIGYYYHLHHTSEILQVVRHSQLPSIGDAYLPLKESFPMLFNYTFNSFTPKLIEFTEDEYDQFYSVIQSL